MNWEGLLTPFLIHKILNVKELITNIIQQELEGSDNFLVGVDTNQAETDLKFFIDGLQGVSVQICTKLSRKISRILDEKYTEDHPIRYEISSPGVDEPLVDQRQYTQHIGRNLAVTDIEETQVEGELLKVSNSSILLEIKISKNKKEKREIAFENIKSSIVKVSFKPRKK